MEIHLKVIHANDFVKVDTSGVMDHTASLNMLSWIVSNHPDGSDFLIDLRDSKPSPSSTVMDIINVVGFMLKNFTTFRKKIAILAQIERMKYPGFFEDYSRNRGLDVMLFDNFEEAISWLMRMYD